MAFYLHKVIRKKIVVDILKATDEKTRIRIRNSVVRIRIRTQKARIHNTGCNRYHHFMSLVPFPGVVWGHSLIDSFNSRWTDILSFNSMNELSWESITGTLVIGSLQR